MSRGSPDELSRRPVSTGYGHSEPLCFRGIFQGYPWYMLKLENLSTGSGFQMAYGHREPLCRGHGGA